MATRFAIASGNWSSGAIWDNGIGPVAGDFVFANGNIVTIDQNINVGYISNGASGAYLPNIATPAMTANNAPSGISSASTVNSTFQAWQAFDQTTFTYWQATAGTGWLRYDFPSSKIIRRYSIFGSSTQSQNPRNWTFEGSNDGTTWTVIHTVTLGAAIAVSTWYDSGVIANSTAYLYYRLNITLSGGTNLMIPEFQMTESTSTTTGVTPNGTFNMSSPYNITCTNTNGIINQATSNANPTLTISATTGNITIASNIRGSATVASGLCLSITGSGHNITINGDIFGGAQGSGGCHAIFRNASGTLAINGAVYGGTNTAANFGIQNTALGTGTITIVGAVAPQGSGVGASISNAGAITLNITGNVGGGPYTNQNTTCITNTAASTINIIGNISISSAGYAGVIGLNNNANSTISVTGTVSGGPSGGTNYGINTSLGSLTVLGNITGGGVTTNQAINHTGGTLSITGNITAGTNCAGVTTTGTSVSVAGDCSASATYAALESTSTTTLVTINGNVYNNGYISAIVARRLGITTNTAMVYRLATNTGAAYNFYPIGSTALGTPATSDVRSGVVYGGGALTGTLSVPPAASVAVGVPVDTSVGTAIISITDMGALLASYNV